MLNDRTHLIRHAVVLAAGNGERFQNGSRRSKLLTSVGGVPLLIRTLASARTAGVRDAHLILGYDADAVRALATARAPEGLALHFHVNAHWQRENGLSVLAARAGLDGHPFALMMGDHIFDARILRALLESPRRAGETLVGIDSHIADSAMAEEATKVRMDHGRVVAIGKRLEPYDALDTGLFVCDESVFDALERSCAAGDSTLSAGIARLAAERRVRGIDIAPARWCDVDTIADLRFAERLVRHAFGA
jgi:choline kinase